MNNANTNAYNSIANLNLWLKTRTNDRLTLADIPQLIPLRWPFIRDNWTTVLLPNILTTLDSIENSSLTQQQLATLTSYIALETIAVVGTDINPFNSTDVFFQFFLAFQNIYIDSAPVTAQEQTIIDQNVATVSIYSKANFINIQNNVILARDQLADIVGGEDTTYNEVFERQSIPQQLTIDIPSVTQMQAYNNVIKTVDFILANLFSLDSSYINPFALAIYNANNPDFNIAAYSSGQLVKLYVGESLQSLASRYLGNPDKWIDIAIANGLQPPYIDEAGESVLLVSDGENNEIEVPALDSLGNPNNENFYLNQIVFLQSNTQTFPNQRNVINIKQIPISGNLVLTLNGSPNLSNYTVTDVANVRFFAPGTVNSQFLVLIPSTNGTPQLPGEIPYFLQNAGQDLVNAKVDLLIDDSGDLVFNSTNDYQLSYGLTNAIQAIKLKLLVELGSLQKHRQYGFLVVQGTKNNNSAQTSTAIVANLNNQIALDTRFDRVETLTVDYFGNGNNATGYLVNLVVRMAGSNTNLPISFTVNMS